ncbi:30S ribosomal protein S8 [Streptomyces sp. A7024]|uniref:30S ribosomal protein S8 n=1 Tax=Streptomyces coryli TaxID=1128680 RepID=A0A6G4TWJ6_9ACTN|nr:30S ribosomal protein S8 [Streptomyces coryli]
MVRRVSVPQTSQHVCDRIGHGHVMAFGLSRRGFLMLRPSPLTPLMTRERGGCGAVDLRRSSSVFAENY